MRAIKSLLPIVCALTLMPGGAATAAQAAVNAAVAVEPQANIQLCAQPVGTIALSAMPAASAAAVRRVIDQSHCFVVIDPNVTLQAPANRAALIAGLPLHTRRLGTFEWIMPDYKATVTPGAATPDNTTMLALTDNGDMLRITVAASDGAPALIAQR